MGLFFLDQTLAWVPGSLHLMVNWVKEKKNMEVRAFRKQNILSPKNKGVWFKPFVLFPLCPESHCGHAPSCNMGEAAPSLSRRQAWDSLHKPYRVRRELSKEKKKCCPGNKNFCSFFKSYTESPVHSTMAQLNPRPWVWLLWIFLLKNGLGGESGRSEWIGEDWGCSTCRGAAKRVAISGENILM